MRNLLTLNLQGANMLYYEIEKYFETETTPQLLIDCEHIFKRIKAIELNLKSHKITTSKEIKDNIDEITALENDCLDGWVIADTFKTGEETKLKHEVVKKQVSAKTKVNVSQAKEEASARVQYLRRVRNLFKMYKDDAMNIKTSLKASYYNNTGYKSEDKE